MVFPLCLAGVPSSQTDEHGDVAERREAERMATLLLLILANCPLWSNTWSSGPGRPGMESVPSRCLGRFCGPGTVAPPSPGLRGHPRARPARGPAPFSHESDSFTFMWHLPRI